MTENHNDLLICPHSLIGQVTWNCSFPPIRPLSYPLTQINSPGKLEGKKIKKKAIRETKANNYYFVIIIIRSSSFSWNRGCKQTNRGCECVACSLFFLIWYEYFCFCGNFCLINAKIRKEKKKEQQSNNNHHHLDTKFLHPGCKVVYSSFSMNPEFLFFIFKF